MIYYCNRIWHFKTFYNATLCNIDATLPPNDSSKFGLASGVVKAPIRGAEQKGFEGFAKGTLKGVLGLLVKPIIGISDAATDVMIGVKSSVEHQSTQGSSRHQIRPRRALYGRDKIMRNYNLADVSVCILKLFFIFWMQMFSIFSIAFTRRLPLVLFCFAQGSVDSSI